MSFELQGNLIVKSDTQVISERFKKREFVIEKKETSPTGYEFVDTIKFQLTQDKCDLLERFNVGQNVNVSFNVKGNKWEKNGQTSYFVNLDAWKIEEAGDAATNAPAAASAPPEPIPPAADSDGTEDLPF
ncbi:MAG: hypothetical protein B7C24_06540 [Bacteroidetes bacterium 4572_77]|nr:MAG: hypothetical protein B7C24_06540 [Bacteroidetes bacterium 4572_77]